MIHPTCGQKSSVKEVRQVSEPTHKIRRRYWCAACAVPFTTYESVELNESQSRGAFKKQVAVAIRLIQSAAAERLG